MGSIHDVIAALFQYDRHPACVRCVAALAGVIELDPQAFYDYAFNLTTTYSAGVTR